LVGEKSTVTPVTVFSSALSRNRWLNLHGWGAIWVSLSGHSDRSLSCLSIWRMCSVWTTISQSREHFHSQKHYVIPRIAALPVRHFLHLDVSPPLFTRVFNFISFLTT
jgi:hypothetical protein